jgi:hypothetical protein
VPGGKGHLGPAFSAAPEADDQTSDAPCRPPLSPSVMPGSCEGPRTASTTLRQQERLSRPKAPSHRHVRRPHSQASPATDRATLPPRSGFRRSFTTPMLSHGMARPSSITRAIRPGSRGPRAACRTLQSKRSLSTTAMIDRTPLTAPRVAPERSSKHAVKTACAA